MKKVIAILLVFCLCVGLCACGNDSDDDTRSRKKSKKETQQTEETIKEEPIIESGVTIEKLYSIFSDPEEDYKETQLGINRKKFSFRNGKFITEGVLSGDNLIEFSWTFPDIYAETPDEFQAVMDAMKANINNIPDTQFGSAQMILIFMMGIIVFDASVNPTVGEIYSAITEHTEIKTVNWVWNVEVDYAADQAIVHAKYRG